MQQRRVAFGMTDDLLGRRIEQDFAKSPNPRTIQRIRGPQRRRRASIEQRAQLCAGLRRCMLHGQQSIAAIARRLRMDQAGETRVPCSSMVVTMAVLSMSLLA